jgi:hypothetical protein
LTWRSATTAIACAPATIEANPILGPLQNSTPQAFGKGSYASICTSIDAAGHETDSGNDDNDGDEHSFFGELANPDPKDLSPRNIDADFILLFVSSRKCQGTYSKTRKVKVFNEALTIEKKDILGNAPPKQCKRGLTFGLKLWRSKGSGHLMQLPSPFAWLDLFAMNAMHLIYVAWGQMSLNTTSNRRYCPIRSENGGSVIGNAAIKSKKTNNDKNMTTTQQPIQQPTRQPTWRGNRIEWQERNMSFSVSRDVSTPRQCHASQTLLQRDLLGGGKGMFLCLYVNKIVPVNTA